VLLRQCNARITWWQQLPA